MSQNEGHWNQEDEQQLKVNVREKGNSDKEIIVQALATLLFTSSIKSFDYFGESGKKSSIDLIRDILLSFHKGVPYELPGCYFKSKTDDLMPLTQEETTRLQKEFQDKISIDIKSLLGSKPKILYKYNQTYVIFPPFDMEMGPIFPDEVKSLSHIKDIKKENQFYLNYGGDDIMNSDPINNTAEKIECSQLEPKRGQDDDKEKRKKDDFPERNDLVSSDGNSKRPRVNLDDVHVNNEKAPILEYKKDETIVEI